MAARKSAADRDAEAAAEVAAKIDAMRPEFRDAARRLHAVVLGAGPALKPRVWYGMPGYAAEGPVLCFFRADAGFMTFGLTEKARFVPDPAATDRLMPAAWFLTSLDAATEARIAEIVRQAAG